MHTDSGMTGISLSGYMPYMTVASLEMSDEPSLSPKYVLLKIYGVTTNRRGAMICVITLWEWDSCC